MDIVGNKEKGFLGYHWQYYDDEERVEPKLSMVAGFEPWDWIIGSGIYINDIEQTLAGLRYRLSYIALITLLVSLIIIYLLTQKLTSSLRGLTEQVDKISEGNLGLNIPEEYLNRKDEVGILAGSFANIKKILKIL